MSDEELEKILDKAQEIFGYIVNPEIYPKQFEYMLTLARYQLSLPESS